MNASASARPPRSASVDWLLTIGGIWVVAGIYGDLWWHLRNDVDSFITWAHAALYTGLLYTFAVTFAIVWRNRRAGYAWRNALPEGYELTLPGIALFFAGGAADGIGHTLWGFEEGFNALLSPTHQLIGLAIMMLLVGPIRSVLARSEAQTSLREQLPAVLSLGALIALVRWGISPFFAPYAEAMYGPPAQPGFTPDVLNVQAIRIAMEEHGLASVLLATIILTGALLFLVRTLRVRSGGITIALLVGNGLGAIAVSTNAAQVAALLAASAFAGIAGDAILASGRIPDALRSYAIGWTVPFVYTGVLVAVLTVAAKTWWDPIFLSGTIFYSGMFGLLLALVADRTRA